MKRSRFFSFVCILLSALLLAASLPLVAAATPAEDAHLHFDSRGKFRILNFSDIQDDEALDARVKTYIRRSVTQTQPDLIVLTGDNVYGNSVGSETENKTAIREFMNVFESLGVPVALVFGNHDDDGDALSKETQMAFYRTYSVCIAYDEGSSMDGCGTYNVPIYSYADRSKTAFNLWMFDTGSRKNISGYDCMQENQLNWYVDKSNELKADNGGVPVPSIAFQHIIVKEIYDALKRVSSSTSGAIKHDSKYYVLPDNAKAGSVMNEAPCPSKSGNEFSTAVSQGDMLAIVCGHDHINQFVVPHRGIDLICTPSCGYSAYGQDDVRGARVIDLDEASGTYSTFMINNNTFTLDDECVVQTADKYVKDVALCYFQEKNNGSLEGAHARAYSCIYDAVDASHGNGVVLPTDLNAGSTKDTSSSNHVVVYMGYTLTDDPNEALRGLGVFYASSGSSANQYDGQTIDGHTWVLCNYGSHEVSGTDGAVNLNYGTSGDPLYLYATYDAAAGDPITEIRVVDTGASSGIQMSNYPLYSLVYPIVGQHTGASYADLNKSASGDYVYALYRRGGQATIRVPVDSGRLRGAYVAACKKLDEPSVLYTPQSRGSLASARDWVRTNILNGLDNSSVTAYDQAALDQWADTLVGYIAQLTVQTYTITFDTNGGDARESIVYTYADTLALGDATRTGGTFRYWTVAASSGNWTQGEIVDAAAVLRERYGNVTLRAEWALHVADYTVEYYEMQTDGRYPDAPVRTETHEGAIGGSVAAPVQTPTGFLLDETASVLSGTVLEDGSLTLCVCYARRQYTVRFFDDDGEPLRTKQFYYGATPIVPEPQKLADAQYTYAFAGWIPAIVPVTADADYTASYTASPILYTVTFDANGGTCPETSRTIAVQAAFGTLPEASQDGYRFLGWFTQREGGAQILPDSVNTLAGNRTLYAHWAALCVPGDADGDGSVGLADVTVLLRFMAGGWDVTVDASAADVNGDGVLNLKDAILLRRYLAGGWNIVLN